MPVTTHQSNAIITQIGNHKRTAHPDVQPCGHIYYMVQFDTNNTFHTSTKPPDRNDITQSEFSRPMRPAASDRRCHSVLIKPQLVPQQLAAHNTALHYLSASVANCVSCSLCERNPITDGSAHRHKSSPSTNIQRTPSASFHSSRKHNINLKTLLI